MSNAMQAVPDEVRERVAANLRRELKDNRWSERKAAAALGLSPAYINRRASGETELSASDIAMFASFLDVPEQKFFLPITVRSLATVHQLRPTLPAVERDTIACVTRIGA